MHKRIWILVFALGLTWRATAVEPRGNGPYLLPMNCKELLPDPGLFLGFFDAVAMGQARADKNFSRRLFEILAIRDKLSDDSNAVGPNPVDQLVFKTLCFYREQKEPLKPVPYDDAAFLTFLKSAVKDLRAKVDAAALNWELAARQRREFEEQLRANQAAVDALKAEADKEAAQALNRAKAEAARKRK